mmetsp:Transcript_10304/g.37973  ORF Transcript_10304/g.37973 Transcript_10304/m.37973 type:complete len:250 (-) Transcript_10304:101-850(-)
MLPENHSAYCAAFVGCSKAARGLPGSDVPVRGTQCNPLKERTHRSSVAPVMSGSSEAPTRSQWRHSLQYLDLSSKQQAEGVAACAQSIIASQAVTPSVPLRERLDLSSLSLEPSATLLANSSLTNLATFALVCLCEILFIAIERAVSPTTSAKSPWTTPLFSPALHAGILKGSCTILSRITKGKRWVIRLIAARTSTHFSASHRSRSSTKMISLQVPRKEVVPLILQLVAHIENVLDLVQFLSNNVHEA